MTRLNIGKRRFIDWLKAAGDETPPECDGANCPLDAFWIDTQGQNMNCQPGIIVVSSLSDTFTFEERSYRPPRWVEEFMQAIDSLDECGFGSHWQISGNEMLGYVK